MISLNPITISLESFEIDADNEATVVAKAFSGQFLAKILYKFAEGPNQDQHGIEVVTSLDCPHYVLSKIIYEGSMMIESHFDEGVAVSEKTFDA